MVGGLIQRRALFACPLLLAGCMFAALEHDLSRLTEGRSALIGEASDDIVALSSELPLEIQREATRVLGFDENHQSILDSEDVSAALNEALAVIEP